MHITEAQLSGGDVFALTTDGVHGPVNDHRMRILTEGDGAAAKAEALVGAAMSRGSGDDFTAVVAEYRAD